jgi:hypothetical protein
MPAIELCACGRPLHYTDPMVERLIHTMIKELGPTVPVTVDTRTWLVPRHFIALHGITGQNLAGLGFVEITQE